MDRISTDDILGSIDCDYLILGNGNLKEKIITNAASPDNSKPDSVTFSSRTYINEIVKLINSSGAAVFLVREELFGQLQKADLPPEKIIILVANPRLSFIKILNKFFITAQKIYSIHSTAIISSSAVIGERVSIGAYSVIGDNCVIGDDTIIHSHVSIYSKVRIGKRNIIDSHAVIGADGFGHERDENGKYQKFPQLGGVLIGDDVEIGPHTSIDRGALDDTVIGDGAKIDNSVYIAHGCKVGKNCIIVGNAMLSGSVIIEDGAWIAPSVVIRQGIRIGKNSVVGLGAAVVKDVAENTTVAGNPAKLFEKKEYY